MAIIEVSGGGSALQDAINSASSGDTLLVDDGVYSPITFKSEVALTIQSRNGNANCIIDGGHTYDEATDAHTGTRCVKGVSIVMHRVKGFTLTNGYDSNGAGAALVTLEDCILEYNYSSETGGGCSNVTAKNCVLRENYAKSFGGGSALGTLENCVIYNNVSGSFGGGVQNGTVINCEIYNNQAVYGGGVQAVTDIDNCKIYNNTATNGGGSHNCTLTNCEIYNNTATNGGGGTYGGTITGCEIYGNTANDGGGNYKGVATNCIIHDNVAGAGGSGGCRDGTITNCIVYNNKSGNNSFGETAYTHIYNSLIVNTSIASNQTMCYGGSRYSSTFIGGRSAWDISTTCTIANCIFYGTGNNYGTSTSNTTIIKNCVSYPKVYQHPTPNVEPENFYIVDPLLDENYHLQKGSPCIGAGSAEYLQSATDLDGKAWKTPPSIGCYEFYGSKKYLPSDLHPMGV